MSSYVTGHLTPTQRRILAVLSDGKPHTPEELKGCLDDELAANGAVRVHLANIRKILRPQGQDILCVYVGRAFLYRHIRLINTSE